VKNLVEKITSHNTQFESKRKESGLNMLQTDKIKSFENGIKSDKTNELFKLIERLKIKRERVVESKLVQNEDKFIEI
jgi:hypothetical protein